jgi:hypothetical protein
MRCLGGGVFVRQSADMVGPAFVLLGAITRADAETLTLEGKQVEYEGIRNPGGRRFQSFAQRSPKPLWKALERALKRVQELPECPARFRDHKLLTARFLMSLSLCLKQFCHCDFPDPRDQHALSMLLAFMQGTKLSFCKDGHPTEYNIPYLSVVGWEGWVRHAGGQYDDQHWRGFAKAVLNDAGTILRLRRVFADKRDVLTHDCEHDDAAWRSTFTVDY